LTLRSNNAGLDRCELVGMFEGGGLRDVGTAQRVGGEVHIEQKFGVANGNTSILQIRYYNIQPDRFWWTADRSTDGGKPGPNKIRRSKRIASAPRDNHAAMPENQTAPQDRRAEIINVSVWHGSLDRAQKILAEHPEVASSDIYTAALLGDHEAVARFLAEDPANAIAKGGPRNWDALTHLCFSKFLRLEPARTEGFLSELPRAGADECPG
jgi:hypothetical protein